MDGHKPQAVNLKVRHHHKPYLLRHLSMLVVASWLVFTGLLTITLAGLPVGQPAGVLSVNTAKTSELSVFLHDWVSSAYDPNLLRVDSRPDYVQFSPAHISDPAQASARLAIQKSAESYIPPKDLGATRVLLESSYSKFLGATFQRNTYEQSVTLGDKNYKAYSIVWTGESNGQPITIRLEGLRGPNMLPAAFETVLNTLSFASDGRVLAAKQTVPASYTADLVSPAAVKIYRVTCGSLVVDGQEVSGEHCDASTGSGFFVSSDGHIATSGHVVARNAKDVLVDVLLNDPGSLANFLKYMGLSEYQASVIEQRPELLAAVITRLYDASDSVIKLNNKRSMLLVALGTRAPVIGSEQDLRNLLDFQDTDSLKQAQIIDMDYSSRDLFVLASGSEDGFSTSDVALIKINANDTPYIKLFTGQVTQNMKITVIGFPGDADNILTDNNSLSATATNGTIGAIRVAAGSRYKLYQSDADASHGSSGGPVINEAGEVLGLLTYRYKNEAASDSAKSYIRDIADLKDLARENNVTLGMESTTQSSWERGLQLFAENRFTKAVQEFEKVKNNYPAHRLANSYLASAKKGIASGHDVRDVPFVTAAGVSFIGASGASGTIILMARHNSRHLSYKLASKSKTYRPHHATS